MFNKYMVIFVLVFVQAFAGDNDSAPDKKLASRITYQIGDGGFGSHLLSYFHAKWLSHINKIPLLYKPFPYSNQFKLHEEEQHYDESRKKSWERTVIIKHENDIQYMDPSKTLYSIPFFKEPLDEHQFRKDTFRFDVGWEDVDFKNIIQEACKPVKKITPIKIPKGFISIAVHVRRIQGSETNDTRKQLMLKYPSDNYYMRQIMRLHNTFQGMPLFIYVFTNDPNPVGLANRFEKELNLPHTIFASRPSGNHARTDVLEDLINMSKFDCLIRPESSFSIAAEMLGHHKIVIKPISAQWNPRYEDVAVQKVHVKVNKQKPKKKDEDKKKSKITINAG